MARLFIDGVEAGDLNLWTAASAGAVSTTVPSGMSGTYTWLSNDAGYLSKTLSASKSQLNAAMKIYPLLLTNGELLTFLDSAGTVVACVYMNTTSKKLELRRGIKTGTLLATGDTVIEVNTGYHVEVQYIPLNTGGAFTVKINGVQDVTYSGDTTNGLEDVQAVRVGKYTQYCIRMYVDDIVIDDASWIGITYIQKSQVSGAGTTTQCDPSTGANYACVDEIPASDTDYVSTNVTNEVDTYATGNMTGAIASVKCVQLQARIAYEGSPTPTHIQLGVRSNGADYFATDITPGLSFATVSKVLETDPGTSTAWTETTVNAMEIGVKATA